MTQSTENMLTVLLSFTKYTILYTYQWNKLLFEKDKKKKNKHCRSRLVSTICLDCIPIPFIVLPLFARITKSRIVRFWNWIFPIASSPIRWQMIKWLFQLLSKNTVGLITSVAFSTTSIFISQLVRDENARVAKLGQQLERARDEFSKMLSSGHRVQMYGNRT